MCHFTNSLALVALVKIAILRISWCVLLRISLYFIGSQSTLILNHGNRSVGAHELLRALCLHANCLSHFPSLSLLPPSVAPRWTPFIRVSLEFPANNALPLVIASSHVN